jgi:hypothetical protein
MKRLLVFAAVFAFFLVTSGALLAQSNTSLGTWKLNIAKSKYGTAKPPKSEIRIITAQGDGAKISFEGVGADGSPIAYSYTTNYDGKESPVSGVGHPKGADMIAVKRVDANTTTQTDKRAGKVVGTNRSVVSEDGKVLIITTIGGLDVNGQPRDTVTVWDKQ